MRTDYEYYFAETDNFVVPEVFRDINYVWDALGKANDYLQEQLVEKGVCENRAETHGNVTFYNNYSIGKGTIIYNDVTIMGPVIIGEDCEIMPGAMLRPGTILGNNCSVGHGCEIKNSVVQNYAKIQSLSFVGDSVIGRSARIGSGVIVANRMFNQANIIIKTPDSSIDTGSSFFGCVLGDHSRLGANCVTQPGAMIGKYCWVFPLTPVWGFIPEAKRVMNENKFILKDNERVDLAD